MANQITLSDPLAATIAAKAAEIGKLPEQFLDEMMQNLQSPALEKLPAKLGELYSLLAAATIQSGRQPEQLLDEVTSHLRSLVRGKMSTETEQQISLQESKPASARAAEERDSSESSSTVQSKPPTSLAELEQLLFLEGKISHIPTRQPLTPEAREARERRAQLYGGGKPISEMVIEDRGPY